MKQYDRTPIKIKGYQKIELQMMPTRSESMITAETTIHSPDLPNLLKEKGINVFAWLLYGFVLTLNEYPTLNRFVLNKKLYQHKHFIVSTVIKKDKNKEGNNTLGKFTLNETMGVHEVDKVLKQVIRQTKSKQGNNTDVLMDLIGWMPSFLFGFVKNILKRLDYWDLLPNSIIDDDPLHASMIVANLGSIDGFSVTHHLYNWGTASMFVSFGRLQADGSLDFSFSVDERISEGLILFKALDKFKHIMENPHDYV